MIWSLRPNAYVLFKWTRQLRIGSEFVIWAIAEPSFVRRNLILNKESRDVLSEWNEWWKQFLCDFTNPVDIAIQTEQIKQAITIELWRAQIVYHENGKGRIWCCRASAHVRAHQRWYLFRRAIRVVVITIRRVIIVVSVVVMAWFTFIQWQKTALYIMLGVRKYHV